MDQARVIPYPDGTTRHVLLVCPPGGRLASLLELRPWWSQYDRTWVCERSGDAQQHLAGETVTWLGREEHAGSVRAVLEALRVSRTLLARTDVDLVISGGGLFSLPFLWRARRGHRRTVFLEASDRVDTRSIAGRLGYPLADLFLVQWPEQQALYPRAHLVGALL